MMSMQSNIESEIATLPPSLRAEVLDFVQFVKQRHGLPVFTPVDAKVTDAGDSSFFQALEAAGLVGCIETDEELSVLYKTKLDFPDKHGALLE